MLLPCPWCGPRNATEFRFGGEAGRRPDPASASPEEWRRYLYFHTNPAGWSTETWYHGAGCRRFLTVERHTVTHEVRAARDTATGTTGEGIS
ncbi:sarcosine oxidase subunit delta [Actinomycetospora sp. NBRC 106375]|uniref:sarcosine oxidase subunit delta n=1 Tax=Actinomycetospora sp. NBRC 106375 TaxID=3032207 RepID=UPI0024A25A4D|nr:sarcosine oxidase subunit delta [Actinomycetospora sp. NBRC 106375]GLZ49076.1 sarcosine oxidase subunit delta [Actinomycetospora sp. NBRC 106375]